MTHKQKKLIRKIKGRWQGMKPQDRPALDQPQNAILILRGKEEAKLRASRLWPLSQELVEFIKAPDL